MGVTAKALSRWNDSRMFYDRALRLFETTGDRTMGGLAKYNIAELLSDQGLYDDAEPLLRDVIRVWRASGAETRTRRQPKRELGRLMARRGDVETARELLQSARLQQVHAGQQNEVLTTDFRLAELLVLAGRAVKRSRSSTSSCRAVELLGASVSRPGPAARRRLGVDPVGPSR